jgi:PAS domain S-box-containing protein
LLCVGRAWGGTHDFLIENWRAMEGIPENSALAVAQTPDGYLWVGSDGGLLRFNGVDFARADQISDLTRLKGVVFSLRTDRSGRLWASTDAGLAVYEQGTWRRIQGTNVTMRTVAEDAAGHLVLGGFGGQLWTVKDYKIEPFQAPKGLKPSGVFCMTDYQDGTLWVANRGFIGRLTAQGWVRLGPSTGAISNSMVAAPARKGGIWVYDKDELKRYQANGTVTTFRARDVDQPRELLEDSSGMIWIASITGGLTWCQPGVRSYSITSSNGLAHSSIWCIIEDKERNIWAGGSLAGLNRLKVRQFVTVGMTDGLPDNIVRSVTESSPGEIMVGTHGGGSVRIKNGKVTGIGPTSAHAQNRYSWSLLRDKSGRLWTGTYNGGLLVEENGIQRSFPLPPALGLIIHSLMEDSHGRLWFGAFSGVGVIQSNTLVACSTNTILADLSVTALAEDRRSGAIYVGTRTHGVFRLEGGDFTRIASVSGIPANRISSLTVDSDGNLWVGMFDHGLACVSNDTVTLLGRQQGLPADTVGSMLEDGLGWYWLGSSLGILRVSHKELYGVVNGISSRASFNVYNHSDGLDCDYCTEGYQPAAVRDSNGRLWFGTGKGVVTVDPAKLRLNMNPPPVQVKCVRFTDSSGSNHVIFPSLTEKVIIPAGSIELEFVFDVLSYTAPEKVRLAYLLEGAGKNWVDIGNRRELHFRALAPCTYHLRVKAANNDGLWNETGATLVFSVRPYLWQTLWFRILGLAAVAMCGGFAAWRLTDFRLKQRIQHLDELQRRDERFRSLIENASDLITVMNPEGIITFQSPSSERVLGFKPEEMIGRNIKEFVHPEDQLRARENLQNAWLNPDKPMVVAARFKHRDGTGRLLEAMGRILPGELADGQLILNTRDITESKKMEEQFRQAQKMEAVGLLAGGIAHDFNNILAAILMQLSLLQQDPSLTPEMRSSLDDLEAGAKRAASLTRQLLLFGRRQVMEIKPLDFNELLEGLIRMLKRLLGENVDLLLHGPAGALWVEADKGMMEQVITNLCINARDAMPDGGRLTIGTANVEFDAVSSGRRAEARPGKFVCLSVADTGCGMDEATLNQVFQPFFTTKEVGKGTGLGLATVFGIVKQHQGWIEVESEVGVGSVFRVFLPARDALPSAQRSSVAKPSPGGREIILMVEDNEALREMTAQWLLHLGYQVLEAPNGREALEHWNQHGGNVSLLLTDMVMPGGMSGLDLAEQLRKMNPALKVIISSGYSVEITRRNLLQARGIEYLAKPYEGPALASMIRQCLDAA